MQDSCGDWVTALCPYGDDGCPDNEGDYDVEMPEPMNDAPGYGYKVRKTNWLPARLLKVEYIFSLQIRVRYTT